MSEILEQIKEASGFDINDVLSEVLASIPDEDTFDQIVIELGKKCLADSSFRQDLGDFGGLEVLLQSISKDDERSSRFQTLLKSLKPILHGSKTNKEILRECAFLTVVVDRTFNLDGSVNPDCVRFLSTAVSSCDENRKVVGTPLTIAALIKITAAAPATSETFVVCTELIVKLCTQDDTNKASPVGVWCRDQIAEEYLDDLFACLNAAKQILPKNQKTFLSLCCCFSSKAEIVTRLVDELKLLEIIKAVVTEAREAGAASDPKMVMQAFKLIRNLAFTDTLKSPLYDIISAHVLAKIEVFLSAPYDRVVMTEMLFGILAVVTLHSKDISGDIWQIPGFPEFLRVHMLKLSGKALLQCLQLVRNSARHGVSVCDAVIAVIRDGELATKEDCSRTQTLVGEIVRIDDRKKAEEAELI